MSATDTHTHTSTEPDLVTVWAASTALPTHQGPQGGVVVVFRGILWTSDPTWRTQGDLHMGTCTLGLGCNGRA